MLICIALFINLQIAAIKFNIFTINVTFHSGFEFYETSAKENINVNETFET